MHRYEVKDVLQTKLALGALCTSTLWVSFAGEDDWYVQHEYQKPEDDSVFYSAKMARSFARACTKHEKAWNLK